MELFFLTKNNTRLSLSQEESDYRLYRDSFSFYAFIFGPLFLLWNQLWLLAAIAIILDGIIIFLATLHLFASFSIMISFILIHVIIALEACNLKLSYDEQSNDIIDVIFGDKITAEKMLYLAFLKNISEHKSSAHPEVSDSMTWLDAWKDKS